MKEKKEKRRKRKWRKKWKWRRNDVIEGGKWRKGCENEEIMANESNENILMCNMKISIMAK